MSRTITDGGLETQDINDVRVYTFDWDDNLASTASISTSTFTITAIKPRADTALTKDNPAIATTNRQTQIRLMGGTLGGLYEIANKIVTDESPTQTKERSFRLLIENK